MRPHKKRSPFVETDMVSGMRCAKCGSELSHVVIANAPLTEAMTREVEMFESNKHRKTCDGEVFSFEEKRS